MSTKFSQMPVLTTVTDSVIVPVVDTSSGLDSKQSTVGDIKDFILTGNAASASKLETAVNINGTAFDGSADISIDVTGNVFYVTPEGSDTNSGTSWGLAFATIQYACTQITGPATIRVAAGTYTEQLPIIVPSNVAIIGDSIRTTIVQPDTGYEEETMWLLGDGAILNKMHFVGLTGFQPYVLDDTDIENSTVGGIYVAFDPANPILIKSPYVLECTAKSSGAIGALVDGSVHATGIKSMVFHGYTVISDLGVGYWVKDNGKAEIVSCFTYYCHIGYATSGGGKIRALNGNNSYGTYGVLSTGYNVDETTLDGTVYGDQLTYSNESLSGSFESGDTITGSISGATGTVTDFQPTANKVYYKRTSVAPFQNNETISVSGGASAAITSSGVSGQNGFVLVLNGLSEEPKPGASIEFTSGDTTTYVIQSVSGYLSGQAIIVLAGEKSVTSSDGTGFKIRYEFSNIRLTGHDFLNVGTGGITTTNYPDKPLQAPSQGNEVIEQFPARVFYVSTDQDGNFRVGEYFRVDQATGRATLNASAFDLSGLTSLRLGSIGAQVGEVINEFSSDTTLSGNSNLAVPTEAAVRQYFTKVGTNLAPNVDNTLTLGTPSKRWNHVYVGPGSITIGNLTLTDNAGSLEIKTADTLNPAPVALDSITNGTSNVSVALDGDITITAGGDVALTVSNTLTTVSGDLTVNGGIIVNGENYTIESTNYSVVDSIIDLHNPVGGGPLIADDGRDIGLKMHYYKTTDKFAFLGWANDTGYLEYYSNGNETSGVFSGTYGTIKAGGLVITGTAALNGGISVDSTAFTVADTTGNVSTAGTLHAGGAVTFASTVGITGATTLSSSLEVTGATTLHSTLGVTGAATLSSSLGVTGAITGQSTVSATQYTSTIVTGTAPLVITSTTKVDNLNADLLDGYNTDTNNTASTIVVRDSNKTIAISAVTFSGSTSGSTTLQSLAISSGTLTLPAATDTLVARDTTDTLTNKTLTSPVLTTPAIGSAGAKFNGSSTGFTTVIATASASGTLTLPAATDTLVARDTTDTLTNKTLTSPALTAPTVTNGVILNGASSGTTKIIASVSATGTLTLPATSDTLVARATFDTLTNKTLTNPTIDGFVGDTSVINVGSGQFYKSTTGKIGVGTTSPSTTVHINATDAVTIPVGDTSQRPTGANGMFRYNTDDGGFEGYTADGWGPIGGAGSKVTISDVPPASPKAGALWWNNTAGRLYVYYDDGTGMQWVEASPNQAGLISVPVRQQFTATASQTIFTITGGYTPGCVDVFLNGVKLVNGIDVTVTSGTNVVLASGATVGSIVDVVGLNSASLADALPISGGNLSGDLSLQSLTYTGTLTGSTGVVNIGSGQIYKDALGNIGIGTSTPGDKLTVSAGRIRLDQDYQIVWQNSGTNRARIYGDSGSNVIIETGSSNTERVRISSEGYVGIGTSSPSFPSGGGVEIYNSTVPRLKFTNSTTGTASTDGTQFLVSGSDFYIQQRESASVIISTAGTDRLIVDSSGNLGLGVTPNAWYSNAKSLEFQGGSLWSSTTTNMLLMANAYLNASASYIYRVNGAASYYYQAAGAHSWSTAPSGTAGNALSWTQAMTLDASGRLSVPNQPMFQGYISSRFTPSSSSTKVTSNFGVLINIGSCWNTSTYRFTAPVAGVYEVHCGFMKDTAGTSAIHWDVSVNGSLGGSRYRCRSWESSGYLAVSNTWLISLSVNDFIEFYSFSSGSQVYEDHSSFYIKFLN